LPGLPPAQDQGLPPMTATGVGGGVGMGGVGGGVMLPSVSMAMGTSAALSASPAAANHFGSAFPTDGSRDHESLCVICIDARRSHVFLPCGHFCCCENCIPKANGVCPMCRQPVKETHRIFA